MMDGFLAGAAASLAVSRLAIAAWLLLSTLQWLVGAPVFSEQGLAPWARLARQRGRPIVSRLRRRMSVRRLRLWLTAQLLAGIVLLASPSAPISVAALAVLIASYGLFLALTGEFWAGGDDKMGMIAMAGVLFVGLGVLLKDPGVALAGALIAGGQLVLCYAVAGWSKVAVAGWRSGAVLTQIMATEFWSHPLTLRLTRRPAVAFLAAWCVILVEALFPIALFAPRPWLIAALGATLAFHFATAVTMRLNAFPWAFLGAYPSVLLLGDAIRASLGLSG